MLIITNIIKDVYTLREVHATEKLKETESRSGEETPPK
jgi:hypothetical protein